MRASAAESEADRLSEEELLAQMTYECVLDSMTGMARTSLVGTLSLQEQIQHRRLYPGLHTYLLCIPTSRTSSEQSC